MPTITLSGKATPSLACPSDKNEVTYWSNELRGFGLRCRASGARSWLVQYRTKAGDLRKHALGDPARVKFAEARAEAERLLSAVKLNRDPAGEIKEARDAAKSAISVSNLAEKYLAHQKQRMRPRSYEELRRHLGARRDGGKSRPRHGKPLDIRPLLGRPAARVTQREVVEVLQGIAELAPTTSNRVRASLSAMFAWGMKAGLVSVNPVVATFLPAQEKPRERVLSDGELASIWRCTAGGGDYDRIVRLLMLTGCRREEIAAMRWSELTLREDGTAAWLLPSERSKNGLPHALILPALVVVQLPVPHNNDQRKRRELLFGEGNGPFSGWSRCKERLDGRVTKANKNKPIAPWVLHDMRRTFVTRLNDIGVEPHVIEALVNHASGHARAGVAGIYNRSAYGPQKAVALKRWCEHIAKIAEINDDAVCGEGQANDGSGAV